MQISVGICVGWNLFVTVLFFLFFSFFLCNHPIRFLYDIYTIQFGFFMILLFILFAVSLQDQIIIKPPKKSFLASRVILLFMATICVFYICTNCLKQIGTRVSSYSSVQFVKQPCDASNIPPEEIRYLHFPEPLTYSR